MMKNRRNRLLIPALFITCISGFFSCGVDRWPEYAHQIELDNWMYTTMQENYLWYQGMPAYKDLNLFLDPASFLSKVKSSQDSYSFVDTIMATPLPTYGFDYALVRSVDIDTAYNALITYVIPESPAAKAGLQRGNWIMKVDTSYISKKHEVALLQGTKSVELVMGRFEKVLLEGEAGAEPVSVDKVVPNNITLQMSNAQIVEDSPVHYATVINLSNGAKAGYLMYNSFIAGTLADPDKYSKELLKIASEFKTNNVTDLILDFRYNTGGTIECAQLLSTLIAPSAIQGQTMAFLEYNDKNTNRNATLTFDPKLLAGSSNLNLSSVIFITSSLTVGASEMVIHSINGKIPATYIVGANTKGQGVATEKFVNETFQWAVNPAVCTIYNDKHDALGGFAATYPLAETSNYFKFLPFGNREELLLHAAIGVLEGTYPPKEEPQTRTSVSSVKVEKHVSSAASRRFVGGGGLQL